MSGVLTAEERTGQEKGGQEQLMGDINVGSSRVWKLPQKLFRKQENFVRKRDSLITRKDGSHDKEKEHASITTKQIAHNRQ